MNDVSRCGQSALLSHYSAADVSMIQGYRAGSTAVDITIAVNRDDVIVGCGLWSADE